jgi:hypothetical protein
MPDTSSSNRWTALSSNDHARGHSRTQAQLTQLTLHDRSSGRPPSRASDGLSLRRGRPAEATERRDERLAGPASDI